MFHIYVSYSKTFNKIYLGFTSNLEQRLISHNLKATKGWTIRYRPWKLIYHEEYDSKAEAMKREQSLKSHQGRDFMRKRLLISLTFL